MNDTKIQSYWISAPLQGEIREDRVCEPGPNEVRVKTLYSAISRGTETLIYRGEVPESQRAIMRAPFQVGEFPGPVKYGYASVGRVDSAHPQLAGREVFCLYPHQTVYTVPETAVLALPHDVPAARAILAANMETAINVLWDARLRLGERVSIIGAGAVGLLCAYLAQRTIGCEVELIDINTAKRRFASALGVRFAEPGAARDNRDCLIHASASEQGLQLALALAGFEARIVEASWYGERAVRVGLGEGFHSRRLRIVSSQVSRLPADLERRWDHRRRLALALGLLRDPCLDALINAQGPFHRLPEIMAQLNTRPDDTVCYRVTYPTP